MNLFDRNDSIQEAFDEFHEEHPEVYEMFRAYAAKARDAGFECFSSDMICHRIRWYHTVEKADREFKINNNFTSRYARKLIQDDPSYAGFFELRILKSP